MASRIPRELHVAKPGYPAGLRKTTGGFASTSSHSINTEERWDLAPSTCPCRRFWSPLGPPRYRRCSPQWRSNSAPRRVRRGDGAAAAVSVCHRVQWQGGERPRGMHEVDLAALPCALLSAPSCRRRRARPPLAALRCAVSQPIAHPQRQRQLRGNALRPHHVVGVEEAEVGATALGARGRSRHCTCVACATTAANHSSMLEPPPGAFLRRCFSPERSTVLSIWLLRCVRASAGLIESHQCDTFQVAQLAPGVGSGLAST